MKIRRFGQIIWKTFAPAYRWAVLPMVPIAVALIVSGGPVRAANTTSLKMMIWNFQPDVVKDLVKSFEEQNKGIKVELEIIPSAQYVAKIQLMKTANTPFDVLYVHDNMLGLWASWLEPLDQYDGIGALKQDLNKLARGTMTYGGKLYGLPYYTAFFPLILNEKMAKAAGIAAAPKTYEEWSEQARLIKSKGLSKSPMIWPMRQSGFNGMWVIYAMAESRGGRVLDEKLHVTPQATESLKWWAQTYKDGLSDPNGLELDNNQAALAFMSGDYYSMINSSLYAGPQWANSNEKSKIAGEAKLEVLPGNHQTIGYTRMYAINKDSKHKPEALRLIKYLGGRAADGEFQMPKQWVVRGFLTWGYRGLEKDPAISDYLKSWGADPAKIGKALDSSVALQDVAPVQSPWFAEWELYANGVLQNVLGGRSSPEEAVKLWQEKATALSRRYR